MNTLLSILYFKRLLPATLIMLLCINGTNAQFNYGTGNVAGNPTAPLITYTGNDAVISTTGTIPAGTYNFANLTINSGVTVTVTGATGPLVLLCTGTANINGAIRMEGGNGGTGNAGFGQQAPGTAGAGANGWGGNGGAGGTPGGSPNGVPGVSFGISAGGGAGGVGAPTSGPFAGGGGGGAGYKTAGTAGVAADGGAGGAAGLTYGDALITTSMTSSSITTVLLGGSGGGGGGARGNITYQSGGGGGGGGGAIQLTANAITFGAGGLLSVKGGAGGPGKNQSGAYGGGGGGGSGGTILIQYATGITGFVLGTNSNILGGPGGAAAGSRGGAGGAGAEGRILVVQDVVSGCSGTPAAGTITASLPTICPGLTDTLSVAGFPPSSGYRFQWQQSSQQGGPFTNVAGGTGDTTSTYITPALSATTYYQCIITCNNSGLSTPTGVMEITVTNLPAPVVSSNSPVCEGSVLNLNAVNIPGAIFNWTGPGNYPNQQNPSKPNATLADSGTYTVIATIGTCQSAPATVDVIVSPAPVLAGNVSYVTPACTGSNLQLLAPALPGASYAWTGPNTFSDTAQNPLRSNLTLTDSGDYTVVATLGSCASAPVTLYVSVGETPVAPTLITTADTICTSDSAQICAPGNFASYLWNTNDVTACTQAKAAGGYWVTVTAANGCSVTSNRVNILTYPVSSVSIVVQGDTLASFGASSYQWFKDDVLIPGATSSFYIVQETGSYSVRITTANGCSATSSKVAVTKVGIGEPGATVSFDVFPNPASGHLYVNYAGTGHWQLGIYNTLGVKVMEQNFNFNNYQQVVIPVSSLSRGLYLLQLQQTGKQPFIKTVVLQ